MGQDFEAGRPPAGRDGLYELVRKALAPHVGRETRKIVEHGNELHPDLGAIERQQGIPDVGVAIIFRPTQDAYVDEMAAALQLSMPFDAGVSGQDDISVMRIQQAIQEMTGSGRFPKKLIGAARAAMTQHQTVIAKMQAMLGR